MHAQEDTIKNCIIFDCDGVLVDSEHIAHKIYTHYLQTLGCQISEDEYLEQFSGTNMHYIKCTIKAKDNIEIPNDFFDRQDANLIHAYTQKLKPLTYKTLIQAQTWGIDYCIASNGPTHAIERMLEITKIKSFFDSKHIFSAQQIGKSKPAPDLFLFAAQQMQKKPSECIVIEDSSFGIEAALNANMTVIGFLGSTHAQNQNYIQKIKQYAIPIAHKESELIVLLKKYIIKNS